MDGGLYPVRLDRFRQTRPTPREHEALGRSLRHCVVLRVSEGLGGRSPDQHPAGGSVMRGSTGVPEGFCSGACPAGARLRPRCARDHAGWPGLTMHILATGLLTGHARHAMRADTISLQGSAGPCAASSTHARRAGDPASGHDCARSAWSFLQSRDAIRSECAVLSEPSAESP